MQSRRFENLKFPIRKVQDFRAQIFMVRVYKLQLHTIISSYTIVCVLYFLIFVQIRSWIGQTRLLKIIDDGAAFRIIGRIGCATRCRRLAAIRRKAKTRQPLKLFVTKIERYQRPNLQYRYIIYSTHADTHVIQCLLPSGCIAIPNNLLLQRIFHRARERHPIRANCTCL